MRYVVGFTLVLALAALGVALRGCGEGEGEGETCGIPGPGWFVQCSPRRVDLSDVSFTDTNTGTVVGYEGTILRTTDGGATWVAQQSGTTALLLGVSFTDTNTGTVVGTRGTILRTTDGGATWVAQNSGTDLNLLDVSFSDANNGVAVSQAYGEYIGGVWWVLGEALILHTTDGGVTWSTAVPLDGARPDSNCNGVSFVDANNWVFVCGSDIWYTNGRFYSVVYSPIGSDLRDVDVKTFSDTNTDTNIGVVVGDDGTILRTTDGVTWVEQQSGTIGFLLGVSFTDTNTGTVVGTRGTILRTTDGGTTWTAQDSGTTFSLLGVSFTDANTGTAVGLGGTILRTIDGG
jgi:photosystem II stability/assembly factor-like uncharacterized protein